MGFLVVTNHTTGEGVSGIVQINEDTPVRFGPLSANNGTSDTFWAQGDGLTVKVAVNGAPHNGEAVASGLSLPQYGVIVLEITQNGYVNYYTEGSATTNAPIR